MSEQVLTPVARSELSIPDYELLRSIGRGAYGEVWLARNLTGSFVALKIIHRAAFDHDRPFEREFEGIKRFEPISRSDPSQVTILHVGRGEGFFYYVMELADASGASNQLSVISNQSPKPRAKPQNTDHCLLITSYTPNTLKRLLNDRGALPANECITIALTLTHALAHLHKNGLVHRDVKPSNVIFVNGVAKLADIGLVTSVDATRSFVGTEGYLPPEGAGTPSADCYSLGKLLYELSTGHDRTAWPEPPADLAARPDRERLLELNAILHRACAPDPRERYANAEAMLVDLDRLGGGKSVRRAHQVERRWRLVRRGTGWLAVPACIVTLIAVASRVWQPPANPEVSKRSTNEFANRQYDIGRNFYRQNDNNMDTAAKYFEAAAKADPNFGLAQAALALSLSWGGHHPFEFSYPRLSQALPIAKGALRLDPNLSEAHLVVAWHACFREWDWDKASKEFKNAIRCDPANSQPYLHYGFFLSGIGRTNQAIHQLEEAERRGGSDTAINDFFGGVLLAARRYSEAVDKYRKARSMADGQGEDTALAWALFWKEGTDEAIEKWVDAYYGAKEEWVSDLKRVLREQGLAAFWSKRLEALQKRTKDAMILAEASALAGRTDDALGFLDQAYHEHHDFLVPGLKTGPEYDSLRGEPRFKALLKLLKLDK